MPTTRRAFIKSVSAAVGAASLSASVLEGEELSAAAATLGATTISSNNNEKLWYTKPASVWLEALPIGNGRISAMVFGGTDRERFQLNEGTLWAGGPHDYTSPEGLAALPEIRRMVFAEKWNEAQRLVDSKFMGRPAGQMPYQTVGDLHIDFVNPGPVTDYHRELDLNTAVTTTSYTASGVKYTREAFASAPHNIIVVRITADKPGSISFKASFESPQKVSVRSDGADTLSISGVSGESGGVKGAVKFQANVKVAASGGKAAAENNSLAVNNADSVTLHIAIATSYNSYSDVTGDAAARVSTALNGSASIPYDRLRKDHIVDYQKLYRRVSIRLGDGSASNLPTDQRVARYREGSDPELAALHFQFGRYLLISCSRPGGQPATLQGLWNDSVSPPWGSKYTININTEMNYWPTGSTNLAECYQPLVQMLKELSEAGKRAAKGLYGAQGWVCHHNTDGWRGTSPVDASFYGMWPMGGAWLCKNLWDRYEYTHDLDHLRECYPIIKEAVQFFLNTLVQYPGKGWLVTCPSISPEHGHHAGVSICAGPTMDIQILNDLFSSCVKASELLDVDHDLSERWKLAQSKFPPMQIGKEGQLQEWLEDWDMTAEDIHHRHVSHLYGLYPSDQITKRQTPQLFAAARKSLEIRGDESTGWSLAWKINLWARLEDGDRACKLLGLLLTPERTAPNLFDLHPPFQIDGNFGATAGIAEMLLQCKNGEIHLLPALPTAWPSGQVTGLCARAAFTVGLTWSKGKLTGALIESHAGQKCMLRLAEQTVSFTTKKGAKYRIDADLKLLS